MKRFISILVVVAMLSSVMPALAISDDGNQAYQLDGYQTDVTTIALIDGQGGGGGSGGDPSAPIIKCKWEYDMDVVITDYDECDPPACFYHDAVPCIDHLQVRPIIGSTVTVGYYAVVTSPLGINPDPNSLGYVYTYADVWHPDGQFKYQIELTPVGWNVETHEYNKAAALYEWSHVYSSHSDLIMPNEPWVLTLPPGTIWTDDVYDELNEELALLYFVTAEISYCQPGGHYFVGATAFDKLGNQAAYLYNNYWYIPTSAVEIDFSSVDYSPVHVGTHKVVGGDIDMTTPNKPTVRNIGNTPVQLSIEQDDMMFGQTGDEWNVHYDARMNANGEYVYYDPWQTVQIPGTLPMCTQEKLDFSILVDKAVSGYTYTGWMKIWAYIDWTEYVWGTPSQFIGNAPYPIPQLYAGPTDPWGDE
jgi:hypothetical protein